LLKGKLAKKPPFSSRIFPQQPCVLSFYIYWINRVETTMASDIHHELETGSKVSERENQGRGSALRNLFSLPGAGTLAGGFICFIAALATGSFASSHSWRAEVPLVFTIVLLLVALAFGAWAGVVGTVLSALVFATHLFSPLGQLRVANDAARSNLGWMLMIGIAFSFLFAPQKTSSRRQ
jgi:K+-sensing histidine kinase KdpD